MRILAVWELGGGMGHVSLISSVLDEFRRRGDRVFVAARNVVSARTAIGQGEIPIYPAPYSISGSPPLPPSASYPEVLLRVGYHDAETLRALLESWCHLFDLLQPDAVFAEHSPTAVLAARIQGLPCAHAGTGFTVPPCDRPMPPFFNLTATAGPRLAAAESQVLQVINTALQGIGCEPLSHVAAIFDHSMPVLCTYPELDHYGERAGVDYWGTIDRAHWPGGFPGWPAGRKRRIFVYLHHHYPAFSGLVGQLQRLGNPVLLVSPGIPASLAAKVSTVNIKVTARPVDLREAVKAAPVIFTNAGHGTAASLLLLGTPMVMLPRFVEQSAFAYRLAQQGLGIMASPNPANHDYGKMIDKLTATAQYTEHAVRFAERWAGVERPVRLAALMERLVTWYSNDD